MTQRRAVVVMGKVPRPGWVKTRLVPPLSPEMARRLYEAFLADVFLLVDRARQDEAFERVFACLVAEGEGLQAAEALTPSGWRVVPQRGDDLGARLEAAREDACAEDVVIIGSDSPTLPSARLLEAFDALERSRGDQTAVIGPAPDGGYYLIALSEPLPRLLESMPWSTNRVLGATRAAARSAGIRLIELDEWYDVDLVDDLDRVLRDAARDSSTRAAVQDALATLEAGD